MSAGRMGGPAQDKHSVQQICLFFLNSKHLTKSEIPFMRGAY